MKTETTTWLGVTLLGVVAFSTARMLADATNPPVAEQWREIELVFTAETNHPNPYTDVEFHLEFEGPNGARLIRPGFWDGGKTYRVRFASPTAEGEWHWRSLATPPDAGLHGKQGTITSAANSGGDAFLKHGLLRMSPGARTIVHADETPFLMVADTPWALPWRATVNDARAYASEHHSENNIDQLTRLMVE